MTNTLLMGNEAFARAALEAGVRVVAGYPGTPSSEVVETIAKLHASGAAQGVHVEWSTNEKAALELLAGASYAGARTLFTCKQMGMNVASDALMSLNYVGVEGGCVLFVADDPGPISSQTEQDTRRFADFAKVPVFDPANVEQGMEMMHAAFDLSERYRTPVIVRSTTRVSHSSAFVDVAETTQARQAPGFAKDDSRFVIFPARATRGHVEINNRLAQITHEFSGLPGEFGTCQGGETAGAAQVAQASDSASDGAAQAVQMPNAALGGAGQAAQPFGAVSEAGWVAPNGSAPVDLSRFNPVEDHGENPRFGIVCGGVSTAYAREALAMLGESCELPAYRFMQVGTPFPFPEQLADAFCEGLDAIFVCEELDSVLEDALVRMAGLRAARGESAPRVLGRRSGAALNVGENTPDDLRERFAKFLGVEIGVKAADTMPQADLAEPAFDPVPCDLPPRPPVLCAGCPHRGAFYAAKQAVRKMHVQARFHGDIGCYTLGNARPLDAVDTCLCMGAGITMAQGMGVAEPGVKQLAFVGDSTFFASGMTGVANAVYNQHDITVCVLDNSTTAMTGGQPHPGTGAMLMGSHTEPLSIEGVLQVLGVRCIEFANPHHLEESIEAVTRAVSYEGPSAVVFRAPCVNLVKPGAPAVVDTEQCVGCKRCITSIGCPAIGFDGERATIDRALCNGCGLCTQVCPFDAILLSGGSKTAQ